MRTISPWSRTAARRPATASAPSRNASPTRLGEGQVTGADGRPSADLYGYRVRADALAELICSSDPPFSIAVSSEWGRGKTTLVNTVIALLQQSPSETPVIVLRYEPWRFRLDSFDDVWLSLMDDLRNQVQDTKKLWNKSSLRKFRAASRHAAIRRFVESMGSLANMAFPSAHTLTESLIEWSPVRDKEIKNHDFFSANRRAFRSLVAGASCRVLLVIDDMDRCSPAASLHILRALEVFARSSNLTILLAMDRDVVLRTLKETLGSGSDAVEYLHKIVELSVTLPRVSAHDSQKVLKDLLGEAEHKRHAALRTKPLCDFVVEELLYNPRALERFRSVYDFRWQVLEKELSIMPDPWKTAMQSIIEIRWPQWNAVAYRFPTAEEHFKKHLKGQKVDLGSYKELLKPFLRNEQLCKCYRRYFRLKP